MFKSFFIFSVLLLCAPAWAAPAPPLASKHVLVVDEVTGEPLLSKAADETVPIASLTKLMTAMVVLDAGQDLSELLTVTKEDIDTLKHTKRGLPVGTTLPRQTMVELALQTSDNRAASVLARNFPGGLAGFLRAVNSKANALGLQRTRIVEPTGLSPLNRSTASEVAALVQAATAYPLISSVSRLPTLTVAVNGQLETAHNTNKLVGQDGWNILLSKTGFTNEAGRCLVMRLQEAGRVIRVVLLGGFTKDSRTLDSLNIQRWLRGEPPLAELAGSSPKARATAATKKKKATLKVARVRTKRR